jgi:hypothetical protein
MNCVTVVAGDEINLRGAALYHPAFVAVFALP